MVPNQSENSKYNLILVWFNKIWKRFLYAQSSQRFNKSFALNSNPRLGTLGEMDFRFLPNSEECDRSNGFPVDYGTKLIQLGSYSIGKLSLRSYFFEFEINMKSISLSVRTYIYTHTEIDFFCKVNQTEFEYIYQFLVIICFIFKPNAMIFWFPIQCSKRTEFYYNV